MLARGKVAEVSSILEPFDSVSKTARRQFVKKAEKMGISEEELLALAVDAVIKGKVKFETKKVYVTV